MPRTVRDILDHSDELAKRFEDYEPKADDERDPDTFTALRQAVQSRARAERSIVEAVARARAGGCSWQTIGSLLGTSGEAARQRYGPRRAA
ncbi:MAG: hypothetical protein ACYCXW_11065 [Solirubrobacteraceae bacterium]